MSVVITIAQQKGGAGKTMLAAHLAAYWAATRRVCLLDIDPQKSLARWHQLRAHHPALPKIAFSDVSGWRLRAELDRLSRAADLLIIDTPPQIDTDAAAAIRAASLVLVPVQPSLPDLWAMEGTLKLAKAEKRTLAAILNRAPPKSALRAEVEKGIAHLGVTLLPTSLGDRRNFAATFARGMGVTEGAPRSPAANELTALAAQTLEFCQ